MHRFLFSFLAVLVLYSIGALCSAHSESSLSSTSSPYSQHRYIYSPLDKPRSGFFEAVLEGAADHKSRCKPSGLIGDACCDYEYVEDMNHILTNRLRGLVKTPFFRYQKIDLFKECPFWRDDNGLCMNQACAVETTDEENVPIEWRESSLSKVKTAETGEVPSISNDGYVYRDGDFCLLEDLDGPNDGVYVDLYSNPERFTGYAGPSAHKVWKAIYEENCFGAVPYLLPPSMGKELGGSGFVSVDKSASLSGGFGGSPSSSLSSLSSPNLHSLMGSLAAPRDVGEELCLEKRVFYRLISGLHASISIHICDEYLDQTTGEWSPNLDCFITRIAQHPERLENVYFDYVLFLRALSKAGDYLKKSVNVLDRETSDSFIKLVDEASSCPNTFDETGMFEGVEAETLKQEFKDHFRNVSRIMDCVGCDKCRLWGKTQVMGLGTALKLLFSFEEETSFSSEFGLQRSELVAFVNTLNRLSESLAAVEKFRQMWANRDHREKMKEENYHESEPQSVPEQQARGFSFISSSSTPSSPLVVEPPINSRRVNPPPLPQITNSTYFTTLENLLSRYRKSVLSCVEIIAGLMKGAIAKAEL